MFLRAAMLCGAAALVLAAPSPDQSNDPSHYSNGVQSSYGPPISPAYAAAAAAAAAAPAAPAPAVSTAYGSPNTFPYEPFFEQETAVGNSFSDPIASALGFKFSAIGFVLKTLSWLVLHAWGFVLGVVATFAFCKVTAVCDLSYHQQVAEHLHEQVRSLMTPQRLASASRMLNDAMDKYSKKKAYSKKN